MRVVFVSSEIVPFAKTGGLADVAGTLPVELARRGVKVHVFMPYYRQIAEGDHKTEQTNISFRVQVGDAKKKVSLIDGQLDEGRVPVHFIREDAAFDREALYGTPQGDYPDNAARFALFSRAVLEAIKTLSLNPDLIHVNDWQAALIPVYTRTLESRALGHTATLLTIHNLAYQGVFPAETYPLTGLPEEHYNWRELEFYDQVNFLKGGIVFSNAVNTVSKRYAEEIQTAEFGCGLEGVLRERSHSLYGIVNGVDYTKWDPSVDDFIPRKYSPKKPAGKAACKAQLQKDVGLPVDNKAPLIGLIGRLVDQKGLDILAPAVDEIISMDAQMVVLGTGSDKYHRLLENVAAKHPDKVAAKITFDNALAHRIEAGSDIFLMPSRYEPCGLNQLYSLRYGTVPVVHATGGLADTIVQYTPELLKEGRANGFRFEEYTTKALLNTLKEALSLYREDPAAWRDLMLAGMKQDWSWSRSAAEYIELYEKLVGEGKTQGSAKEA